MGYFATHLSTTRFCCCKSSQICTEQTSSLEERKKTTTDPQKQHLLTPTHPEEAIIKHASSGNIDDFHNICIARAIFDAVGSLHFLLLSQRQDNHIKHAWNKLFLFFYILWNITLTITAGDVKRN